MKGYRCIHFCSCAMMNAAGGYRAEIDEVCDGDKCPLYLPENYEWYGESLGELLLDSLISFNLGRTPKTSSEDSEPASEIESYPF